MKELTKDDSKLLKGIAILLMLGLHLYNRTDTVGYYTSLITINNNSLVYYISFLFDACVPIYCFCAGYAAYINKDRKANLSKILINYWIILVITSIVGMIFNHETIPGSFTDFLGSLFLYDIHYVGAWWFIQTYVLLTISSKYIIKLIDKIKPILFTFIVLIIYCISYYFRIMNSVSTSIYIINIVISALVLYGTSLLPYVYGIYFSKYHMTTKIRDINIKHKNLFACSLIVLCIVLHNIIKSMFVAPFIALIFICSIILIDFNKYIKNIFIYFGNHSTNIWLVHMQFYMIFFKDLVFCTDTVIGCFIILIVLSLISSYIINAVQKLIY